jgi:hypothetical protein
MALLPVEFFPEYYGQTLLPRAENERWKAYLRADLFLM